MIPDSTRRWLKRRQRKKHNVLFLCASAIDELWVRSSALACARAGLSTCLSIAGDTASVDPAVLRAYEEASVITRETASFDEIRSTPCELAVTASSGLGKDLLPGHPAKVVHMPHSIASLHMIYPADAFDGYDVLFAAGPHHVQEFNALTRSRSLPPRRAMAIGYGKLDLLRGAKASRRATETGRGHVLIAPSWGPDNLLDRMGLDLALALLERGLTVTLRPHPLFFIEKATVLDALKQLASTHAHFRLESPFDGDGALLEADVMIGDYSGSAFEFSALRRRPVLSVDVGLKEINPCWRMLGLEPVEIALREQIGEVVEPSLQRVVERALVLRGAPDLGNQVAEAFLFNPERCCGEFARDGLLHLLGE